MDELLKANLYERDPSGFGETRLRAATLMCKVFLQYVVRLVEVQGDLVGVVFVGVLDKLERFMRGEREMLVSALIADVLRCLWQNEAGESLKNVILVMNSSNLLIPPAMKPSDDQRTPEQVDLWNKSVERIERILPGFLREAIPPPAPAVAGPVDVVRRSTEGRISQSEARKSVEKQ